MINLCGLTKCICPSHLVCLLWPFLYLVTIVMFFITLVLENCSIHHAEEITSMIDFNPIEETFSKVKTEMKHMTMEASMTDIMDIDTIA